MSNNAAGWADYGVPRMVPNNARMYVLTNEQLNFIASLVATTNDVLSIQIPGPFNVDQNEQAFIIHRMDFIIRQRPVTGAIASGHSLLQIDLQYSDKEPAANWNGNGEDVEDENTQAMFDGPFFVGETGPTMAPDADATLAVSQHGVVLSNVHYYPPDEDGLDTFFPVTIVITRQSYDLDLVDQIADQIDFAAFETFSVRIFFTVRDLTTREKQLMESEFYGVVPFA